MTTVRLKPGEKVTVVAQDPSLKPDNTLPPFGQSPVDPGYGYPEKPVDPSYGIPIDGPYPDIGFPEDQPHPDHTLPGDQPHPDHELPPVVVLPPNPVDPPHPDHSLPPFPSHPIVLPPEVAPPTTPDGTPIEWKILWTPMTGWVVVGIPQGPHVTPSKRKK